MDHLRLASARGSPAAGGGLHPDRAGAGLPMKRLTMGLGLAVLAAGPALAETGRLVIAGGAVDPANDALYGAFIAEAARHAADPRAPRFVIVPAGSAEPRGSAEAMIGHLVRRGVAREVIAVAEIAMVDDPETPAVDESRWRDGASLASEIAKLSTADGIWFVGGDQSRIIATLKTHQGGDTPFLARLRARWRTGAAIGGTSAGAAMMSGPMIVAGDSPAALVLPVGAAAGPLGEPLSMGQGLGFFSFGLVDQHFDRRKRLGRLARALGALSPTQRLGFGVDENTALVVDVDRHAARVVGAGAVTVLDARKPGRLRREPYALRSATLTMLTDGDAIDLRSLHVTPSSGKVLVATPLSERSRPEARLASELLALPVGAAHRLTQPIGDHARVDFSFARARGARVFVGPDQPDRSGVTLIDVKLSITSHIQSKEPQGRP
ncbi:cyanophycinase [Caulobacter vibrioides]|uniref:cyanophycinase n=1 Tax=Caulobacter vibrioides TaxID=155892 RepID=UPI001E3331AC|nr:cyanophycinase [Caulobacter vibrioides]